MYKEKPKIKEYSCVGCCFLHEFRKYTAQKKGKKSIFGQYTSRWGCISPSVPPFSECMERGIIFTKEQ